MKCSATRRRAASLAVLTASVLAVAACSSDSKTTSTTSEPTVTSAPASDTSAPVTTGSAAATTVPASVDIAPADTSTPTSGGAGTPATGAGSCVYCVETDDGLVQLDAQPTRIVALSPTHTETLFAIGAGEQVIAVDDQSNFPAEAEAVRTDLSGYNPNIEAIAGYDPDLVIISDNTAGVATLLEEIGIPVWTGSAADTLDELYAEVQQLGTLTGHGDEASELITSMQDEITAILAEVPETEVPLTYYHELDNTYFSITSDTFLGQLYSLANLQNIADRTEADTTYPQLSSEFIISNDPQLIFLADTKCCGESIDTVAARDGWSEIAAVRNGDVIEMDDDIASRWGPRVVDYLAAIVDAVNAAVSVPAG